MIHLVRLAAVVVFLGLGLRLRHLASGPERRRGVNLLIAYVLVVHGLVLLHGLSTLSGLDGWPFTNHTIAVSRARLDMRFCLTEFVGVTSEGREWRVDPYTWSPVFDSILQYWVEYHLAPLSPEGRRAVLAFLLEKAEAGRRRLARGDAIGYDRRLGLVSASYWLLLPRLKAVPPRPYSGLRIYQACWTPRERLAEPDRVTRLLVAEVRA